MLEFEKRTACLFFETLTIHKIKGDAKMKIYAEFDNGTEKIFEGETEGHAMCDIVEYAEKNGTSVTFYTEVTE